MTLVFGNESEERKIILNELKEYTISNDIYKLATNLNNLLKTKEQRVLIESILPFIPQRHQEKLKSLMSNEVVLKNHAAAIGAIEIKLPNSDKKNSVSKDVLYSYKPCKTQSDLTIHADTSKTQKDFNKRYKK